MAQKKKKTSTAITKQSRKGIGGRPWFNGKDEKDVVAKLEFAFKIGSDFKEACQHADISYDSFWRYVKANPELRDRFDRLRENPCLQARFTAYKAIREDANKAIQFLKDKKPHEFPGMNKVQIEQRVSHDHTFQMSEETLAIKNEFENRLKEQYRKEILKREAIEGETIPNYEPEGTNEA